MKTSQPMSLSNRSLQSPGMFFETCKRLIDICGSAVGILVLLPVLGFCALWIRLVDGGPVFYSQWRVGTDGWLFKIYKFRIILEPA